jgi:hypothetical protein
MYYNGLVKWVNIISAHYSFLFAKGIVMLKLLIVFAAALVLAYISEQNTKAIVASGRRYFVWNDWAYLLLVTILVLFAGLRTAYNDTWTYMNSFRTTPVLSDWLVDAENYNPFKNPLFYFLQSTLRSFTGNPQWLVFCASLVTQVCFVRFFKHYSDRFCFSIFIYFTLGTYVFTLAAIKQVTAMALVTLAFPYLEKKKWVPYYIIIAVAMLIHTYAMAFAVLPFFRTRPWKLFTFFFITVMVIVMMNFEEAITEFMEQANDLGKTLADYEVFDNNTINIFRLAVYAVPPIVSLVFQLWIFKGSTKTDNILIHMSIISLAFMSLGTQSGANMFARMAMYFELGTICCLPSMLEKTFDKRSYHLVSIIAVICFFAFFVYANAFAGNFGQEYKWIFS